MHLSRVANIGLLDGVEILYLDSVFLCSSMYSLDWLFIWTGMWLSMKQWLEYTGKKNSSLIFYFLLWLLLLLSSSSSLIQHFFIMVMITLFVNYKACMKRKKKRNLEYLFIHLAMQHIRSSMPWFLFIYYCLMHNTCLSTCILLFLY